MTYRYIGYGTTNANGIAVLDHDENGNTITGYTGTGAGKLDFIASTDNPLSEGSLQSEIYEVTDCVFKDLGTQDSYAAWTSDSNFTVSRSDVETTITPTDTTAFASRYLAITAYNVPFVIEFDFCMNFTGNGGSIVMAIRQGSSSKATVTPNALGLTSGEYSHIKLTVTSTELQINVDGTDKTPVTHDGVFNRFSILQNGNLLWQSIKYRNFLIYPV